MTPILVTGAAQGLGAEICRYLAAAGHDLVIHYRTHEEKARQLVGECRTQNVQAEMLWGDFSTPDSLQAFIVSVQKSFPEVKGVVHNVGNFLKAPMLEMEMTQWHDLFQVNFFAPIQMTQSLLPSVRRQKGAILNIGVSGLQAKRGFIKTTAYAATKSALLFYTLSLAKELAEEGVSVNMISPGFMENAQDLAEFPMKRRPATLSEVARLAAFLFDPQNRYITGQNIEIAGGYAL